MSRWPFVVGFTGIILGSLFMAGRGVVIDEIGRRQVTCALQAQPVLKIGRTEARLLCRMLWGL